jgi:hypothetical protein
MAGLFGELFGKKDKSVSVDDLIVRIDTAIGNLNIKTDADIPDEDSLITKSITDVLVPDGDNKKESGAGAEIDALRNRFETAGLDPIFKDLAVPEERLQRYKTYDSIYNNVQIIKKILATYLDNIFQKDSISNKVFLIKEIDKDKSSGEIDEYKKFAEKFIAFFNLDERMRNLVFKSLKYGDSYLEYIKLDDIKDQFPKVKPSEVDKLNKGSIDTSTSSFLNSNFISESRDLETIQESVNQKYSSSKNNGKPLIDDLDVDKLSSMLFEYTELTEESLNDTDAIFNYEMDGDAQKEKQDSKKRNKGKKSDPLKGSNLNGIVLRYHDPHKIVPIVSDYDNVLGYIEVRSIEKKGSESFNPVLGFMDIIKKTTNNMGGGKSQEKYDTTVKMFSQTIAKKVIAKYKIFYDETKVDASQKRKMEEDYNKLIKSNLDDEIYYSLKRLLLDTGHTSLFYKKLAVRFIPVDSMFKFPISSSSTYPFGESIIDPLVYPAKLYLLTQLSNIVTKLSRSSIIRKWTVDVGSRENESDILNRLKKQIRNQKITASDLSSSKEIPRLLSDFRDFVTFTKKGQRFVDVETLQHGDPNIGIRDLEDQRKDLIALSGVPAAFLGYQDHYELREQLIHTNIQFATTISSIQHVINTGVNDLMDQVSLDVGFDEPMSEYVKLSLVPPVSLILQLVESTITSVSNIQRVFMEMPILKDADPTYLLRRYVPYIDWDDYLKEAKSFKLQKDVLKDKQAMEPGGGGGGFGGGY